jgi:hypothetical protein
MRFLLGLLLAACSSKPEPPTVDVLVVVPGSWTDCDVGCAELVGTSLYAIDREPANQNDMSSCVKAGVCEDIGSDQSDPAVVDRERARQYCSWRGARLPTELERKRARLAVPHRNDLRGEMGGLEWTEQDCVRIGATGGIATWNEDACDAGTWVRCARDFPYR